MDSPQDLGPVARRRQARKNRLDMCKFIFIEYCYNWWIQNICSVIHVLDKKYLLVQKYFLPLPLPRVEALTGGGPRWAVAARQPVEWYWPDMGLIEGTPGQGTFTQYCGSNWHKYFKQKAYLCLTWLFCQFQCCSAQFSQLEADKSVSPPGLCPPGDGGHWQWSSGQWAPH